MIMWGLPNDAEDRRLHAKLCTHIIPQSLLVICVYLKIACEHAMMYSGSAYTL